MAPFSFESKFNKRFWIEREKRIYTLKTCTAKNRLVPFYLDEYRAQPVSIKQPSRRILFLFKPANSKGKSIKSAGASRQFAIISRAAAVSLWKKRKPPPPQRSPLNPFILARVLKGRPVLPAAIIPPHPTCRKQNDLRLVSRGKKGIKRDARPRADVQRRLFSSTRGCRLAGCVEKTFFVRICSRRCTTNFWSFDSKILYNIVIR